MNKDFAILWYSFIFYFFRIKESIHSCFCSVEFAEAIKKIVDKQKSSPQRFYINFGKFFLHSTNKNNFTSCVKISGT